MHKASGAHTATRKAAPQRCVNCILGGRRRFRTVKLSVSPDAWLAPGRCYVHTECETVPLIRRGCGELPLARHDCSIRRAARHGAFRMNVAGSTIADFRAQTFPAMPPAHIRESFGNSSLRPGGNDLRVARHRSAAGLNITERRYGIQYDGR